LQTFFRKALYFKQKMPIFFFNFNSVFCVFSLFSSGILALPFSAHS